MIDLRCIYVLRDPRTGAPRYVGQAADPIRRLELHVAKAFRQRREARTPVEAWVYELVVGGHGLPAVDVVEFTAAAYASERAWIAQLEAEGRQLLNVPYGARMGPSQRQAAAARMRGRTLPESTRQRMASSATAAWAPGGARHASR